MTRPRRAMAVAFWSTVSGHGASPRTTSRSTPAQGFGAEPRPQKMVWARPDEMGRVQRAGRRPATLSLRQVPPYLLAWPWCDTFTGSDDVRHHPHTMAAYIGSDPFAETSAYYQHP